MDEEVVFWGVWMGVVGVGLGGGEEGGGWGLWGMMI